jgi:hypothetical protein
MSWWGAIDIDRHGETDLPYDWAEISWQVTKSDLPLTVAQSTGGKGCWLFLFLKEPYSSAAVRAYLASLASRLGVTGEIFPKQNFIAPDCVGNGMNLPYFGSERVAFFGNGERLSLDGFLDWAELNRVYGRSFDTRPFRRDGTSGEITRSPMSLGTDPIFPWAALKKFEEQLSIASQATTGNRHHSLQAACCWAVRCVRCGAAIDTDLKPRIWNTALSLFNPSELRSRNLRKELRDCWAYAEKVVQRDLIVTRSDVEAIGLIDAIQFHRSWGGDTSDFASADAARQYMEQELERVGVHDPKRLLHASGLDNAQAHEKLEELLRQS